MFLSLITEETSLLERNNFHYFVLNMKAISAKTFIKPFSFDFERIRREELLLLSTGGKDGPTDNISMALKLL